MMLIRSISLALRRPIAAAVASLVLLCGCEPPATAVTVQGSAEVVDGDSLEIGVTEIRLFGVDAPEGRQTCRRNGTAWRCGEDAATHLRALVGGGSLTCVQRDVDSYGRMVAVCTRGSVDVGREMVSSGMALAYRQYSRDYVDAEDAARAARRGIWGSEFEAPWDWRRDDAGGRAASSAPNRSARDADAPAAGASSASSTCRIKGNISRAGDRIYHVPGSSSYDETLIDTARGERWFCSEQEAQQAGWRAPRGR